jgi:hypothetical protein
MINQLALAVALEAGFQYFLKQARAMGHNPKDTFNQRAVFFAGCVYGSRGYVGRL